VKKTFTINLGGLAFVIDEDAYSKLKNYFDSIESHFENENERKEIIEDIESRMLKFLKINSKTKKR